MLCSLGNPWRVWPKVHGPQSAYVSGFIDSHVKIGKKNRRGATLILFFPCNTRIHSTIRHVALFTIISAENLIAPLPPSAVVALFRTFFILKNEKPRVFGKNHVFRILTKSSMFFSLHFFIGKTHMFEHRNLSRNLFRHVLLDFEKRLF